MPHKDTAHPWQQIEDQAFHAFREWPLWLVLRRRELQRQTQPAAAPGPGRPARPGLPPAQPQGH